MSIQQLKTHIASGKYDFKNPMEGITGENLRPRKSVYYKTPLISNNDTFVFNFTDITPTSNKYDYTLTITIYKYNNGTITRDSIIRLNTLTGSSFNRDLYPALAYYVEVESNIPVSISFTMSSQGYKFVKTFEAVANMGQTLDFGGLYVEKQRPTKECDIPLYYDFLEGELPMGIELTRRGYLQGTPCNIDDYSNVDAPSFNWFYTDIDGVNVSFGMVFRFKVKVYAILPDGVIGNNEDERWFCLRLLNNWSFDKALIEPKREIIEHTICDGDVPDEKLQIIDPNFCPVCDENTDEELFLNSLPEFAKIDAKEFCPAIPDEIDPNEYKETKLETELPLLMNCEACQDPTGDIDREIIHLDKSFFTPDDLMRYFFYYDNNVLLQVNNTTMPKLYASELFMELVDYIRSEDNRNTPSIVELRLHNGGNVLELLRFKDSKDRPLNSVQAKWDAIKNIKNQNMEIESNSYIGYNVTAEYRYAGQ